MWQLDSDATYASSGSTFAGFESGTRTTAGDEEAGTESPPSKVQVCSREYLPDMYSGVAALQQMVALCCDMGAPLPRGRPVGEHRRGSHRSRSVASLRACALRS